MFSTAIGIQFDEDRASRRTVLEIVAGDRPGLLSTIGQVFIEYGIEIDTAKIMTIGERAEDVFYLRDRQGRPLDAALCESLRERLAARLEAEA